MHLRARLRDQRVPIDAAGVEEAVMTIHHAGEDVKDRGFRAQVLRATAQRQGVKPFKIGRGVAGQIVQMQAQPIR
jgi:hypothetical protein